MYMWGKKHNNESQCCGNYRKCLWWRSAQQGQVRTRVKGLFPDKESKSLSAAAWFIYYNQSGVGRGEGERGLICEKQKQKLILLTSVYDYPELCLNMMWYDGIRLPWWQLVFILAILIPSQHPDAIPLWCLMCLCSNYQQALGCRDQIGSDFTLFSKRKEFIPLIATCLQSRTCSSFLKSATETKL